MSNNLRTRNGMPFNFVNGLKVRGMDIESLIPGIEGIPEAGSKYQFAGDGVNKVFTLPVTPYNKDAIEVHVKQLYVHSTDYTLVGDTVTFAEAPPAIVVGETYNVEIKVNLTTLNGYVDASRVSFEGENLDDILEKSKPLANYAQLRAYTGNATQVRITQSGIAGFFYRDDTDTTSTDNGGTVIVASNGKRWKRIYDSGYGMVDWFDTKGGSVDDTIAIQNALDAGFTTLVFTKAKYTVSAAEGALECLLLSKNTNLVGAGGGRRTIIEGVLNGTTTPSVLRVAITDAGGYSDVRNWYIVGLSIYPVSGGKHGIHFDGTVNGAKAILTSSITNCTFGSRTTNGGYAIYIDSALAHCEFSLNTIENGVYAKCFDANVFRKNTTFGLNCAFTFDCVNGVRNNTVKDNTIVNRDGIVRVINGDNIRIINNQTEQMLGYTPSANQNAVSSMIWIQGVDRPIYNTVIRDNNFGGGTNVNHLIYVDNAQRTVIDDNNLIAVNTAEVFFTSNSKYNIFKTTQRTGSQLSNPRTRSLFKAKTIDLGVGNMGTLKDGSVLSLQNGWNGAEFYKDEYGIVRFIGSFKSGSTTAGTIIGTLPLGFRPYFQPDTVRRNKLNYTEQLSNAIYWYKSGVSITDNVAAGPDGEQTADLITVSSTANTIHSFTRHFSYYLSLSGNAVYAFSLYLKRASTLTKDIVKVELIDNTATKYVRVGVNLATGAIQSSNFNAAYFSNASATISDAGNGVYRLMVVLTTTSAGASSTYVVGITPNDVTSINTAYAGDPTIHQVIAWGWQFEDNVVTDYQRVTGDATYETVFSTKNIPVSTDVGPGTVSINRQGVINVVSLPGNAYVDFSPIQAADTE